LRRRGQVGFKLCVSPPVELDGLSSAQLRELVARLLAKLADLERKRLVSPAFSDADRCAELVTLKRSIRSSLRRC